MSDQTSTETVEKKDEKTQTQEVNVESKETETWKDGEQFDAKKAQELIGKLRAEVRDLKPKAKKADEYSEAEQKRREAEMSELEKIQQRADALEIENKRLKVDTLKQSVAAKLGLPESLALRLQGETKEEIEADAKEILEILPKKTAPQIDATNPNGGTQRTETDAERRRRLGL